MPLIMRWFAELLSFLRRSRDENLQWRLSRQDEVVELRKAKALAEQALVAQLRKQAQQLAHELAVNKARNSNELAMVKTRCKQDLKDYQQYLQSLDRLKESLRSSYGHLPEAVAFTIHHHAKQLLNRMWEAEEAQEKLRIEMQLLQFMTAVHEDSQASLQGNCRDALPQKSLAIIDARLDD
jgi:transposase-like protein